MLRSSYYRLLAFLTLYICNQKKNYDPSGSCWRVSPRVERNSSSPTSKKLWEIWMYNAREREKYSIYQIRPSIKRHLVCVCHRFLGIDDGRVWRRENYENGMIWKLCLLLLLPGFSSRNNILKRRRGWLNHLGSIMKLHRNGTCTVGYSVVSARALSALQLCWIDHGWDASSTNSLSIYLYLFI